MQCYSTYSKCHPKRQSRCEFAASCKYYERTEPAMHRRIDSFAVFENSEAFAIEDVPAPEVATEEDEALAELAEALAQIIFQRKGAKIGKSRRNAQRGSRASRRS
jgi:hypothetical protein